MHCTAPLKKLNDVVKAHTSIELIPVVNWWAKTQLLIILDSRTFSHKSFSDCLQDEERSRKTWSMTLLLTGTLVHWATLSAFVKPGVHWGGGGWTGWHPPLLYSRPHPHPLEIYWAYIFSLFPPPLFLETLTLPHTPLEDVSKYSSLKVQGFLLINCTSVMWISLPLISWMLTVNFM